MIAPGNIKSQNPVDMLPHDLQAEKYVLGCLLLNAKGIYEIYELLRPEHFYHEHHAVIYRTIIELFDKSHTPDIILVCSTLKENKLLDKINGPFTVMELTNYVNTDVNLKAFSLQIIEHYMKREMAVVARRYYNKIVTNEAGDIFEELDAFQATLSSLGEFNKVDKDMSMRGIGERAMRKLYQSMIEGVPGIPTGIPEIDEVIQSLKPGKLSGLLARSRAGKSAIAGALMASIAYHYVDENYGTDPGAMYSAHKVGLISFEMEDLENYYRLLSNELTYMGYDIPYFKIENVMFNPEMMPVIEQANRNLNDRGIYIDDTVANNERALLVHIRRMVKKYGVKLIFIDYLQLVESEGKDDKTKGLGKLAYNLKKLAVELDIHICALMQAGRDTEKGTPRAPKLGDIQWADAIGANLDLLITLYRPDLYEDNPVNENGESLKDCIIFNFDKHRGGAAGPAYQRIVPFDVRTNSFIRRYADPVRVMSKHKEVKPITITNVF